MNTYFQRETAVETYGMTEKNFATQLSDYQAKYFAHELERSYANDHVGKLAGLLFDAQVEPKPHQIEAALFALKGVTLHAA